MSQNEPNITEREDMSLTEAILYLADTIERFRKDSLTGKASVLKTDEVAPLEGSTPSPSAK